MLSRQGRRARRRFEHRRGVAAMEFAFIAPVMIILFYGTVDVCRAFIAWAEVNNAAAAIAEAGEKLSVTTANSLTKLTYTQMQAAMTTIYAQMPGLDYGKGDGFLGKGTFAVTLSGVIFTPTCAKTTGCASQKPYTMWSSYLAEGGAYLSQTPTQAAPLTRACGALTPVYYFPNNSTQLTTMIFPAYYAGSFGGTVLTMVPQVVADVRFTYVPAFNIFVHSITFWASATLPSPLGGTDNQIVFSNTAPTGNVVSCAAPS